MSALRFMTLFCVSFGFTSTVWRDFDPIAGCVLVGLGLLAAIADWAIGDYFKDKDKKRR